MFEWGCGGGGGAVGGRGAGGGGALGIQSSEWMEVITHIEEEVIRLNAEMDEEGDEAV